MNTMTQDEKDDRLVEYSRKLMKITAQKKELEEAEKHLRSTIGTLAEEGDNFVGDFKVNKRINRRFDGALALKNLTEEELDDIVVTKPDSAKAKANLRTDRLALCQKTFGEVVTVTLRED